MNGTTVRLETANGGAPIDPDDARQLTEPFVRLDRSFGGFGLGLSIVASVVSAHHGRIELTAPPTGGLVVAIELPAAGSPANVVPARSRGALTQS
jgi:hypothetical protein